MPSLFNPLSQLDPPSTTQAAHGVSPIPYSTERTGTTLGSHLPVFVGDICTHSVVTVDPGMSVSEAARLMRDHHVGCLVVADHRWPDRRMVVGIVTDRDLALTVVAHERDVNAYRVGDIMTRDLVTARPQDTVLNALALMRRKRVRRVPVTGAEGELIGIITLDDLLPVLAQQMQAFAAAVGAAQLHEH